MSMETDPRKLPIWTGARGHSRETWEAWRLAIAGYAGGKGLYPLLRPDYVTPSFPTATTTADQRRAYETHQRNTQSLWFLLAQATRGSASAIVARCEHSGNPDGREAWQELEQMYGGRAQDERPVQLLTLERRLRDLQCNSAEESGDFIVKLDTIWGEFEALGNAKADETKRAALLLGIKEALPQVFIQLTTQPGMTYDELKRAVVASSTYLTSDFERRDEAVAFQSRTDGNKAGMGLDRNQCAYCLKRNHRWRECRSYLSGKPPAKRPPGMNRARKFPPPPRNDSSTERKDQAKSFMVMNVSLEDEQVIKSCNEVSMYTSADSRTEVSILCDSGANVHMTPFITDLINKRTINRSCTFGNKAQLRAPAMGDMPIKVKIRGKDDRIAVMLKDVLWVPGIPCRLLSTGTIRRNGGEFVESSSKQSYLRIERNGPKITLNERKGFLTLAASVRASNKKQASVHASFANKKQRLTLKEWHEILGHIDPSAIKYLEKRGLIDITDTTVASEMRCSVCRECKSQALSYARGGRSPKTPGEVIHTDLEGPFHPDVTGMKYFQVFVDEATRDKRVVGLKTRDAATDATANYIDEMAREGLAVKCISGDGAGELGRSGKFQRMLANRGVRWRSSPPRTPQSNGIAERAIQQLMRIARSQLVKAGRGEDYWFFAVADAAFKTAGMPHEYLGGETPHERLTGKPFNYDRLRVWGAECYVHQHQQQRGAGSKFHPYAKRGILVGHDRSSLCWYIWLTQEAKLVKSAHVTFHPEGKLLDIVGELEAVELSDDEEEPTDEQNENGNFGRQTPEHQTTSKRSSIDSGLRRSKRLAQRRRASNAQQKFESSDISDSDNDDFLAALLENENEDAFCMMVPVREITSKQRTTRRRRPLPRETTSRRPRTARVKTLPATKRMALSQATMARRPKATARLPHQSRYGAVKEKRQTTTTIEKSDIRTLTGKSCRKSKEDCWIPIHRSRDSQRSYGHW